jgi:hypothetical protein
MYGMVNRALEEMVVSRWGEAAWTRVKDQAGIDVEVFVGTEAYPDEVTYRLVGATSGTLGLPEAEVLRLFGVHWVLQTATEGYRELMDAGGATLGEFLENLPSFHNRVSLVFPHLAPPTFYCTEVGPSSLRLHYVSGRAGLAPFVTGLLEGLGERFGAEVTVEQAAERSEGGHDEFLVSWAAAAPA